MNRHPVRLVIAAFTLLPTVASAQQCGDTLYHNTTLTQDVVCPTNAPFGLRIGAPKVTLDLNGHSIIVQTDVIVFTFLGPICTPTSIGVEVEGESEATIRNGRIRDIGTCGQSVGIRMASSDASTIDGVEFAASAGSGAIIEGSSDVVVSRNRFHTAIGVWLRPDARSRQHSHRARVVDNTVPASANSRHAFLYAFQSDNTEISNNTLEGVHKLVSADSTYKLRIIDNIALRTTGSSANSPYPAIELANSVKSLVENNWIDGGSIGMRLEGDELVARYNHVSADDLAVSLGGWRPTRWTTVYGNDLITTNKGVGIEFGLLAEKNDGRGNQFTGVATPVIDNGIGNIY